MLRPNRGHIAVFAALLIAPTLFAAEAETSRKAPPERTYSNMPFVHRIVLLDEQGGTITLPKPGEEALAGGADNSTLPFSQAQTCGKCHSDYDVMQRGYHFNFADPSAPHGRPGEPWMLVDAQTRTAIPLSYRPWKGAFHPYDVGINDFNFARLFGRHHTGGGALQTSGDLRFKMSGPLENDCLICHTADSRYDPVARANQISNEQNFKYAAVLAAFLGKVQGSSARLRDNFNPTGPDARRAPKINYDADRFDELHQVVLDLTRDVPNERCYFCHTNVGTPLESRWKHDQDIHLAKGMKCVDCHKHGPDHMIARGYEGEFEDRAKVQGDAADQTITTLSCQGCHYGTDQQLGGRHAAPKPLHHGMPTLHFDKLTCTACHSGPRPTTQAATVQTAMAHKLGLPRHHTQDAAAPTIQQPVFLRDQRSGKIAPYRAIYPSFWARLQGDKLTPILPEHVAAVAGELLGEKPDAKHFESFQPLTSEQIIQVQEKLAAAPAPEMKPADAITARGAAKKPSTAAATQAAGEVVHVTGGKVYRRDSAAGGKLVSRDHPLAEPYEWALGHDVRPAQQSLGARGCIECHAGGAPIFDSIVNTAATFTSGKNVFKMHELRDDAMGALRVFGLTYPLRWPLIVIGYLSAAALLLVYLKQKLRAIGSSD